MGLPGLTMLAPATGCTRAGHHATRGLAVAVSGGAARQHCNAQLQHMLVLVVDAAAAVPCTTHPCSRAAPQGTWPRALPTFMCPGEAPEQVEAGRQLEEGVAQQLQPLIAVLLQAGAGGERLQQDAPIRNPAGPRPRWWALPQRGGDLQPEALPWGRARSTVSRRGSGAARQGG